MFDGFDGFLNSIKQLKPFKPIKHPKPKKTYPPDFQHKKTFIHVFPKK